MLVRNFFVGFCLFLCLVLIALVLGQLNEQPVAIDLLFVQFNRVSLFTFFVAAFSVGGLLGLSVSLLSGLNQRRRIKNLQKQLVQLEHHSEQALEKSVPDKVAEGS